MSRDHASSPFRALPSELDFPAMERRILEFWDEHRSFEQLREKNRDGPRWSFFDGPITANNPMGVHHAWGRTYKDIYQRYRAMCGYHQRYQNGFDAQGLWLEVEVERELGFDSKRDIEAYGVAEFADRCRERVDRYSGIQTDQSVRLGQWMDWPDSYFTHTDENIEHIWHFLKTCHERGWIVKAHRAMPWCPRCGTALSQHELIDTYEEVEHDAVVVRLPLTDQPMASLLVWTTTPWTLAANVAAAVHPNLEYVEIEQAGAHYYLAAAAVERSVRGEFREVRRLPGRELLDRTYLGPFDDLPAVRGVEHRVIPWADVGADEGTGIVHIAPGAGEEDFELGGEHGLPVLVPIDENGCYIEGYGFLTGRDARVVAGDITDHLLKTGALYHQHAYTHRYPHCWRCREELVFRVDDEWFIRVDEIRPRMLAAAAQVRWIPDYAGARMADWLTNMGDWNISRRRFWGLPLPFYECDRCDHLTVIGSRAELSERAVGGLDDLRELHRPWIDAVVIRCEACHGAARRIQAVGDAWLDAGIVPFSTLGYLERDRRWTEWFPADFITEMREQVRLWFYSMLFMSVTLEDRAPYQTAFVYEKLNDENGRPMHKSLGNAIEFQDAAERMGADVMRWVYAGQNPLHNINFGYGPAGEVKRRLLTLWNVYAFFVTYALLDGFDPKRPALPASRRSDLDRWILSRLQRLNAAMTEALDAYLVHRGVREAQTFLDELSNWYVRRSRRRFWRAENDDDKLAAYQTLYEVLTTLVRLLAPVMPFWTEDLYQNLVRSADRAAPASVHHSDWPAADDATSDPELEKAMATVQRVVGVGRAARGSAQLKLRQPLRQGLIAVPDDEAWEAVAARRRHVLDELNLKSIERMPADARLVQHEIKPNFRRLGPRLGSQVKGVGEALARSDAAGLMATLERDGEIVLAVGGETVRLGPEDLDVRQVPHAGYGIAEHDGVIVAVTTDIDDELVLEGLAREVIHAVQLLRRESGFEVSDRIRLWLSGGARVAELRRAHAATIAAEVLAIEVGDGPGPPDAATAERTFHGVEVSMSVRRVEE